MAATHGFTLFRIDPASVTPPFQQLHGCVVDAVATGALVPGARLPTVRALAEHLGLATNTVASAYRSLEAAGVVEGRGRAGTFVRAGADGDPIGEEARRIALAAVDAFVRLGVDRERALTYVSDAYRAGG